MILASPGVARTRLKAHFRAPPGYFWAFGNSTRVLLTRGVLAIMIPWFPVDWVARGPPATQAPRTCSEASRSFAGGPLAAQQCESLNGTRAQASQLQSCFKLKAQTALVGPVVARADLPSQPRAENHWWPRRKSDPGGRAVIIAATKLLLQPRSYYCSREVIIATTQLLLQPRSDYCNHEVLIAPAKLLLQPPCCY